nr:uncharacterized protein A4U43_C02F3220 [Ipomoea batatas]GME15354.1 uncharacterized protein A4U43_C02F3220 [Ipomoea batatas]
MAVSGMRMNMDVAMMLGQLLIVVNGFGLVIGVGFPVTARGHQVHHHGSDGGEHRHQAGERKTPPRLLRQAGARERLKSVRQNMDKSGGQNHTGGKRLYEEEQIALRP